MVATIAISQQIDSSVEALWAKLSDLASHPTWMKDAVAVEFLSEQKSGPGTKMRVPTKVGPFRTTDIIEVTHWIDGQSIAVHHRGLVRGTGIFKISGDDRSSVVTWEEELTFPWWLGGRLTALVARPILRIIWSGNLRRLAAIV